MTSQMRIFGKASARVREWSARQEGKKEGRGGWGRQERKRGGVGGGRTKNSGRGRWVMTSSKNIKYKKIKKK